LIKRCRCGLGGGRLAFVYACTRLPIPNSTPEL